MLYVSLTGICEPDNYKSGCQVTSVLRFVVERRLESLLRRGHFRRVWWDVPDCEYSLSSHLITSARMTELGTATVQGDGLPKDMNWYLGVHGAS